MSASTAEQDPLREFQRQWYLMNRPPRKRAQRNRVVTEQRRARALELLAGGKTYRQAAEELGYANPSSVHRLVGRALADQVAENVENLRAVEYDRLNALQLALWPKAMSGDLRAAHAVLRIIQLRIRLILGPAQAHGDGRNARVTATRPRTLVISEEEAAVLSGVRPHGPSRSIGTSPQSAEEAKL